MRLTRKSATLTALLSSLAVTASPSVPTTAPAEPQPVAVQERIAARDNVAVARLSNGLTVIVKAVRTSPVVCVRAYVRAGGLYEREWLGCGISHLTEHLVAKGAVHNMGTATAKGARQTSGRVKEIGGQSNAYTSLAHTCYYIAASASRTTECVDLIADWLARPAIAREEFQREHGVVQRELEMGKDEPSRQIWYAHAANAFGQHPAAVPVIGYRGPLRQLRYEDVLAYVRRMYVPQNIVFAVVGDIAVKDVLERTQRAFAGFESGRVPDLSLPAVRPFAGVQRVTRTHPTLKETIQQMSFLTIPLIHEDLYALDVLSYVLTQGGASRMVQRIQQDKKLVTSISSSSWTPEWGRGLLTISFRASPDKADAAEAAILDELKRVVADGITAEELGRAKRQKIADYIYDQQTVESQAGTLAIDYLSTGDVGFSRHYTDRIQSVTAEQVRGAARQYFTFDQMAITRLAPPPEAQTHEHAPTAPPSDGGQVFKLPNGLRVVLCPTGPETAGIVSMTFATQGGVLTEDERTNGLGQLMASLSTKGAGGHTAEQIAAFFDQGGGSIQGNCGNNTFYWQATVLDDSFEQALAILADVVQRPSFGAEELEKLRHVLLGEIDEIDQNWYGQLWKFFRHKFFIDSPYRLLSSGATDVVQAATAKQIAEHHRQRIRAGSSVLSVYGNFDAAVADKLIRRLFGALPKGRAEVKTPTKRAVQPGGEWHFLSTQNETAAIMVAAPGMKLDDKDRFALNVLDTIISGWWLPAGWLHEELRGRQLVYVVHGRNWVGLAPGAFLVYASCQPDRAPQVARIILETLRRAAEYKPTEKEIRLAVNTILTCELLENQSIASLSLSAALDELYGFGYDFRKKLERHYRDVTPEDVARVGQKYLGGGFVVTVTTPKPKAFDQAAEEARPSKKPRK